MRHGARAAWFAVTALVTGLLATGLRAERVVGATEPSLVLDVAIPREALEELPMRELERAWRERLRAYDLDVAPGDSGAAPDPDLTFARVTVGGAVPAQADEVHAGLTSAARLEMTFVVDGDRTMERWYAAVRGGELDDLGARVEAEPDYWLVEETGAEHHDHFLSATSRETLDRAVRALAERYPLAPGQRIAYERVEPPPDSAAGAEPYHRTYLLEEIVVLTNRHIAGAEVTFSPYSYLPEVLVTLTREGALRFGDATARNLGRKLAIVLDGRVLSAPVIQAPIHGGRVTITMGGFVPEKSEREAAALAGALGSSSTLPPGLEAKLVGVNDRPMGLVWALRALIALLGGVLAVVVGTLSARRRWFTRAPAVAPGRERWDALAIPALVTFLVPALLWYVAQDFPLPGVNAVELSNILQGDGSIASRAQLGIFALGVMPVVSAFILVELFAILVEALVPARRGRRLGTPADRRRLDLAGWILVGVLALVQAYVIAVYLAGMTGGGVELLVTRGEAVKWLLVATLAAGVMVQIVAAELISRHGLANGYLVLLASGAVIDLFVLLAPSGDPRLLDPDRPAAELFVAIAAASAAATIISTRVRSGDDGPRLPYTGVVPASIVRGGLGLVAVAALWSNAIAERLYELQPWTPALELAAAAPLAALILLSNRRAWTTAGVVATFGFLAVLVLLPFAVPEPYRIVAPFADGVLLGVVAAELWTGALARVRIPDAASVLVVHDVDRADRAADRLAAAGIPFALLDVRARAALRFIGAFAPIAVRVPAARAAEAAAALDDPGVTPAPPLSPPAPPAS